MTSLHDVMSTSTSLTLAVYQRSTVVANSAKRVKDDVRITLNFNGVINVTNV